MIAHEPTMTLPQALSHLRDHGYEIHAGGNHRWQILGHGRDETDDLYSAADVIDLARQAGPVVDDDDDAREADITDEDPVLMQIGLIRTDSGAQMREDLDAETVTHYAAAMQRQGSRYRFPPILVYADGQQQYWLADGFHRVAARRASGGTSILAVVRSGGAREAVLAGLRANTAHGLPLQHPCPLSAHAG